MFIESYMISIKARITNPERERERQRERERDRDRDRDRDRQTDRDIISTRLMKFE
jgi:hypothetical protein